MNDILENNEETPDTMEDFLKELAEYEIKRKKEHPVLAYIDDKFPKGYAGYRVSYIMFRPHKILRHIGQEIKFAKQRVFRGWDDKATWNVGYYLAETLAPIIRQLKEEGHGFPVSMFSEGYDFTLPVKELGGIDKDGNYIETEEDKKALEKWNKILDEIADGLDAYIKYDKEFDYKTPPEEDENYRKFQRALDLLKEYFEDLWD